MAKNEMGHKRDTRASRHPNAEDASSMLFSVRRTAGISSMTAFIAITVIGLIVSLMATYFVTRRSRIQAEANLAAAEAREQRLSEARRLETGVGALRQRPLAEMSKPQLVKNDPKISQALGQCRSIGDAIRLFWRDVGEWPMHSGPSKSSRVDYLYGSGQRPRFKGRARASWGFRSEDIRYLLVKNGRGANPRFKKAVSMDGPGAPSGWNGPYLRQERADPWGRAYLVSACGFPGGTKPDNNVWCLSAGPNGIIETPTSAKEVEGDDIGVWVR